MDLPPDVVLVLVPVPFVPFAGAVVVGVVQTVGDGSEGSRSSSVSFRGLRRR